MVNINANYITLQELEDTLIDHYGYKLKKVGD
jgi:hypothetical protein